MTLHDTLYDIFPSQNYIRRSLGAQVELDQLDGILNGRKCSQITTPSKPERFISLLIQTKLEPTTTQP